MWGKGERLLLECPARKGQRERASSTVGSPIWPRCFMGSLGLTGDLLQAASSLPTVHTVIYRSVRWRPLEGSFWGPADPGRPFPGLLPVLALHFFLTVIPRGMTWFAEQKCPLLFPAPALCLRALNLSSCQGPGRRSHSRTTADSDSNSRAAKDLRDIYKPIPSPHSKLRLREVRRVAPNALLTHADAASGLQVQCSFQDASRPISSQVPPRSRRDFHLEAWPSCLEPPSRDCGKSKR